MLHSLSSRHSHASASPSGARSSKRAVAVLAAIAAITLTAVVASDYTLHWTTIDGGGGTATGGGFTLMSTIGQPDAGTMQGGSFALDGGFWAGVSTSPGAPPCVGDINGDGMVDGADLGLLLFAWGTPGAADLNGDGTIDGADLGLLLNAWGPCAR